MNYRSLFAYVVLAVLSLSASVLGQANVNEGLESATIWVDGSKGSDSNPGTVSLPLRTIGAAITKAIANNYGSIGSRVMINAGTYREALSLAKGQRSTSLPMTFEAATSGTVIISGADVWTGWTPYSANPEVFTHNWPYQYGLCAATPPPSPIEQDILLRREMVIVNGVPLTQVLSLAALQPGTFYVNESSAVVYIRPAVGTNMSTATVEVATRPTLFSMYNPSNVVLRGLTFQYSNACRQNSAVLIYGGTNNLLDHDVFVWNNAVGMFWQSSQNFTVQNSVANHNGQTGFYTSLVMNDLWQSDTAWYNNWRGAQGAFYGWDTGGAKFMWNHNGTFNNLSTNFNQAHGIHFDTDNEKITVNSVVMANNVTGFLLEKSQGPTSIANSYFCRNALLGLVYDGGFVIRNSPSLTMTGNQIRENFTNQIAIIGVADGILVTNSETGSIMKLFTENLTSTGNTVAGSSGTQVFRDGYLGSTDWTLFLSTLRSDNNIWYEETNPISFTSPIWGKLHHLDLHGWQSLTGQDLNSSWTKTAIPSQCTPAAEGPDYWLLSGNILGVKIDSTRRATFNLSTVALGGMTGTVNLTVVGISAIPGANASLNASTLSTSANSVLTVTTGSSTPPGQYPVTVIANSGNLTRTVTLTLIVP